jgi:hypothetical protein
LNNQQPPTPLHATTQPQVIPGAQWDKIKACLLELFGREVRTFSGRTPWQEVLLDIMPENRDFRASFMRYATAITQREERKTAQREGGEPDAEDEPDLHLTYLP